MSAVSPWRMCGVLGDVAIVVVVHKGMTVDRVVERQRDHCEQETHDRVALFGRREQTLRLGRGFSFFGGWQQRDLTTEGAQEHRGGHAKGTGAGNCRFLIDDC